MKNLTKSILLLIVILLFQESSLFGQLTYQKTRAGATTIENSIKFDVNVTPPLVQTTNATANNQAVQYTYFWNFRDGNYAFSNNRSRIRHRYLTGNHYNVYVESTPEYDDDEAPEKHFINNDPNDAVFVGGGYYNSTPTHVINSNLNGKKIDVIPVRSPVRNNLLTFILSYSNQGCGELPSSTGTVRFTCPTNFLSKESPSDFYETYHNETYNQPIPNTDGTITYSWGFNNLQVGEVRHIFIKMRVSPDALEDNLVKGDIVFEDTDGVEPCEQDTDILSLRTGVSHDPNNKIPFPNIICPKPNESTTIDFVINFQNVGDRAAYSVEITDDLLGLAPFSNFTELGVKPKFAPYHYNSGNVLPSGSTTAFWVFEGTGFELRGTNEPGYGTDFPVEDTKGWVKFSLDIPHDYLDECSALLNSASIVFDCNDPIVTDPAVINIQCYSEINDTCSACIENVIELSAQYFDYQSDIQFDFSPEPTPPSNALNQVIKWFPESGVSDSSSVTPDISEQNVYTLIISDSIACTRTIYKKPVIQNTDLDIIPTINDTCNLPTTITLTASGSATDFYGWGQSDVPGECAAGPTQTYTITENGTYTFSVFDGSGSTVYETVEVNTAEGDMEVYDLNCSPTITEMVVSGENPPYTFEWSALYEAQGNPANQFFSFENSSIIDENGTYIFPPNPFFPNDSIFNIVTVNYPVIITNANGCQISYTPDGSCLSPPVLTHNIDLDIYKESLFKIFPNPTTNYIIVQNKNLEPFEVKMYDVNGKLVKTVNSDSKNEKIDLSDFQNGIYFYQIQSNNHIEKGKVVIQR